MKDTFFFTHDFGARNDPKMQNVLMECGCEGWGVFWAIVEQIYEQGGSLPLSCSKSIAFQLHVSLEIVNKIIHDFDLFKNDGELFWSDSINSRLNKRAEIAEKRSKSALKRWTKPKNESKENAKAMQLYEKDMQDCANKEKERKGKENKENTSLNKEDKKAETAKRFTPPSIEEVQSYISEKGYSVDAESFVAFYNSKNWFVGKNKMKDWRSSVITWQKREIKTNTPTQKINDIWK